MPIQFALGDVPVNEETSENSMGPAKVRITTCRGL